ncbi:hypothetical protein Bca101_059532 [Brassica carinata]
MVGISQSSAKSWMEKLGSGNSISPSHLDFSVNTPSHLDLELSSLVSSRFLILGRNRVEEANPRRSFSSSVAETEKTKEDDDGGEDIGKCEVLWVSFSEVRISVLIGFSLVGSSADKDRQLGEAHADIKDLRLSERQREKAVEENLEIKKINEEKKASMAAQFAAEATLRRVHAAQKHEETNHL